MDRISTESPVWVVEGYMDATLVLAGWPGSVVGYSGRRVLVRDRQGQVEVVAPEQVLRLPVSFRERD